MDTDAMTEPKTKIDKFRCGLDLLCGHIQKVEFAHSSGLAMFHLAPPLTEDEQRQLEKLGWSAGANRAGFGDGGAWQ